MESFEALSCFIQVVESGGFSAAARRLGMATSSVTRQVERLETTLGTRLLLRTTRRVSLTVAGERYYGRVRPLLGELRDAREEIQGQQRQARGVLRVSTPLSFGLYVLMPLLPEFKSLYPGIELDLQLSDARVDLLSEGLDLAIRFGELADSSLKARRLMTHWRGLWASPDYLARQGTPRAPAELLGHEALIFPLTEHWYFQQGDHSEVLIPSGRLRVSSPTAVLQGALLGLGIGLLPYWLAQAAEGRLVRLLADWQINHTPEMESSVTCVYPYSNYVPTRLQVFMDFLQVRLRP